MKIQCIRDTSYGTVKLLRTALSYEFEGKLFWVRQKVNFFLKMLVDSFKSIVCSIRKKSTSNIENWNEFLNENNVKKYFFSLLLSFLHSISRSNTYKLIDFKWKWMYLIKKIHTDKNEFGAQSMSVFANTFFIGFINYCVGSGWIKGTKWTTFIMFSLKILFII